MQRAGWKRDDPASDDEDPLCGLVSDDDGRGMPDADTSPGSDETPRQRMCSRWASKNSHEKLRTDTRATTTSADATRNSPICTSFPDEQKGARQSHVSRDVMDDDYISHETLAEITTTLAIQNPEVLKVDVSQSDTTLGKATELPSNWEQSEVFSDRMIKKERKSDDGGAISLIRASKRKVRHHSKQGKYDCVEVIDMTRVADDASREQEPKRRKRAIPRIPPC
ncbi:hypothetical protein FQN50_004390 [Emmonsiellopsis sp. PD_5]|nr:hypothetical protein FQN50_004390 [Emmonsiellopsis sp. PD_5]